MPVLSIFLIIVTNFGRNPTYLFVFGSFWTTIVHDLFNVIFNVLIASVALI